MHLQVVCLPGVRCMSEFLLPLPFDLSHFSHQIADLISIEFGDGGNSVDVPQKVFGRTQEHLKGCLAFASTEQVAVRRDDRLDQPRRGPILVEKAAEDRLEMVADLHLAQLPGAVLADLVGFTDGGVVCHVQLRQES